MCQPPPPHQKPENVLKRAQELIEVNQAPAALTLLHEHVTSKRSRNVPIPSLEPVMVLLVELAVEQKKGRLAKDALYQYKNIAQNSNVGTIEVRKAPPDVRLVGWLVGWVCVLTGYTACPQEVHRAGGREGDRCSAKGR